MANFITRIELHDTKHDSDSYQTLHEAMAANGFKRTIQSNDKDVYHLLTAEYHIIGEYSVQSVLVSAKAAASKTNKEYSVFVAQYSSATWHNLKKVKP